MNCLHAWDQFKSSSILPFVIMFCTKSTTCIELKKKINLFQFGVKCIATFEAVFTFELDQKCLTTNTKYFYPLSTH